MTLKILAAASAACVCLLAGCTNDTQFLASEPNARLSIEDRHYDVLPAKDEYHTRTFGESEFKVETPGHAPFYGVLPLEFSTGHLVTDILIFAPGFFFNLREVWPQYQFDVTRGVIRYREGDEDSWIEYTPSPEEVERSQQYFQQSAKLLVPTAR